MRYRQYEIWMADLNPRFGTEPGKTRPVIIIQSDILNKIHPSVIICPLTTNVNLKVNILRVNLDKGISGIKRRSSIMIDQIRAIDDRRLIKKIGTLQHHQQRKITESIKIILGMD